MGDLHFRTDSWYEAAFEKWLEWFEGLDFGLRSKATLIQLGDPTHKDLLSGDTSYLLKRWIDICTAKFKDVYILVGNHELKSYKGRVQYSTRHLTREPGVCLVTRETELSVNGMKILALPFQRVNGKSVEQYYENDLPKRMYETEYDLIVGHVGAREKSLKFAGVDFTKFKYRELCLGHIHTRLKKSEYAASYVGSALPMSVSEALDDQLPRCLRVYEDGVKSEIEVPQFIQYLEAEYPNPIPKANDDSIKVYKILNCRSLMKARAQYPSNHVYGVEKKADPNEVRAQSEVRRFESPYEALREMIREMNLKVSRTTLGYLKEVLQNWKGS